MNVYVLKLGTNWCYAKKLMEVYTNRLLNMKTISKNITKHKALN